MSMSPETPKGAPQATERGEAIERIAAAIAGVPWQEWQQPLYRHARHPELIDQAERAYVVLVSFLGAHEPKYGVPLSLDERGLLMQCCIEGKNDARLPDEVREAYRTIWSKLAAPSLPL